MTAVEGTRTIGSEIWPCAPTMEVTVPGTLVRSSPLSLPQVDEALLCLSKNLPLLRGVERRMVLREIDRLLDIRTALSAAVEAGE